MSRSPTATKTAPEIQPVAPIATDAAEPEPEPELTPRQRHERARAAIEDHQQRIASLAAEMASVEAQLIARSTRHDQANADLAAMPERLRAAEAGVIIDPGPAAQHRLAALRALQAEGEQALARLDEERGALLAERDRLAADRVRLTHLLPALEQQRQEAWAAIGTEKYERLTATVTGLIAERDAARAALEQAERALAAAREGVQKDLAGGWPDLLASPESRATLLPRAGRPALIAVLDAYAAFLAEFARSAAELDESATVMSTSMPLSKVITSLIPLWAHAAIERNSAHLSAVQQLVAVAIGQAREQVAPRP